MLSPCRVSTIAAAVPALRQIFNRAQHSSPICSAGGPRTVQNPPRRPPRLETGFGPSPSSHPTRSLPASTTRRAPAIISRPKTPQTTSRRLAQLDSPPHERLKSGGPAPVISPRGPRSSPFPLSKPFSPTTYAAPEASADTHSAAPRRFEEFQLHPDLLGPMQERFGVTGKTTAIQTLSLRHFLPSFLGPARVLLGAETGSGKTLAYLLPLFSHLKFTDTRGPSQDEARTLQPRALVLSPTHELTRQSTGMAKALCHVVKLSVMGMSSTKYGGIGDRRGGLDVLCGTGAMTRRMFGLASPRSESKEGEEKRTAYVGVDRLDWVVVDEADVLLGTPHSSESLL